MTFALQIFGFNPLVSNPASGLFKSLGLFFFNRLYDVDNESPRDQTVLKMDVQKIHRAMILVLHDQSLVLVRQRLDKLEHRSPSKGLQQSVNKAGKKITALTVPDVRSSRSYQIPVCIRYLLQVPNTG